MKRLGVSLLFFLFASPVFAADVVINEFQVEPSNIQWVELYNTGSSTRDISGWFIDDSGGSEKYTIPSGTILAPNTCISFQSGKFNWNTSSSDSARLLSGDTLVDSYEFSRSPGLNVSFGRLPDGTGNWRTFSTPTRDKLNANGVLCYIPPMPTPTDTPTPPPATPTHTLTPTRSLMPTATPTNLPTPTRTPIPSPTRRPSPSLTPSDTPTPQASSTGEVLSLSDAENPVPATQSGSLRPLIISFALVGAGCGILALYVLWQKRDLFRALHPPHSDQG